LTGENSPTAGCFHPSTLHFKRDEPLERFAAFEMLTCVFLCHMRGNTVKSYSLNAISVLVLMLSLSSGLSAVDSGLSVIGNTNYPNYLPYRVSGLTLSGGRDPYTLVVTDTANGYGYIAATTGGGPGLIYKVRLGAGNSAPTLVAALSLDPGEVPAFGLGFIDVVNGYLYVITDSIPSTIVKIDLGVGDAPPTRVVALTLNAGDTVGAAVVDPANGHAYLGTVGVNPTTASKVIKVALGTGNAVPVRLNDSGLLGASEYTIRTASIDLAARYAYFGTGTTPGLIVKVALGDGNMPPSRASGIALNAGENTIVSSAIDSINGYLYFGTGTGHLVKFGNSAGGGAPARKNVLALNGGDCSSMSIDAPNKHLYLISNQSFFNNLVIKVNVNVADTAAPISVASTDVGGFFRFGFFFGAIDSISGYAYVGTTNGPADPRGAIGKVLLGAGTAAPSLVQFVDYNSGHDNAITISVDPVMQRGYVVTAPTFAGSVLHLDLNAGNAPPSLRAGSNGINSNNGPSCAVLNSSGTVNYVGISDGLVKRIPTSGAQTSSGTFGDFGNKVMVIDSNDQYLYLASTSSSPILRKFGTGENGTTFGEIDAANRPTMPAFASSIVIDTAGGYLYVGTNNGQVLKYALNGTLAPSLVAGGALNAAPGFNLTSAVIDVSNSYAYFGASTGVGSPGMILKIALGAGAAAPTLTASTFVNSDENSLRAAAIDLSNDVAYFVTSSAPSKVIKIGLPPGAAAPVRVGAITFDSGENSARAAALDTTTGYLYVALAIAPGRVIKVATSHNGRMNASRILIADNASLDEMHFYSHVASGNIRLALYDNSASKQLLWSSGPVAAPVGDLIVPISSGSPSKVSVAPGTYWLAWQSDSTSSVPSYTAGQFGDGFYMDLSFGPFPATLTTETLSDERWTQLVRYTKRPNFRITGSASQTAGNSQNITITALDQAGAALTSYTGNHTLTFTGASQPVLPGTPTINGSALDVPVVINFNGSGSATVAMVLRRAEAVSISCVDPALSAVTTIPLNVNVVPNITNHLFLAGLSTVDAGVANTITLTARDTQGNTTTSFAGSKLSSFGGGSNSPDGNVPTFDGVNQGTAVSINFVAGVGTVSACLFRASTQNLTVNIGGIVQNVALPITVRALDLFKYSVSGPTTATAGVVRTFTIFALDDYGNTAVSTNGQLLLDFSSANSSPNATAPSANGQNFLNVPLVFANGVGSASVILTKAETVPLRVAGGGFSTPVALNVVVSPNVGASIDIAGTATQIQNASQTLNVTVKDSLDNVATSYAGTLAFTCSDASAVFTPASRVMTGLNGITTTSLQLKTQGVQTARATDTLTQALFKTLNITCNAGTVQTVSVSAGSLQSKTVGTMYTTKLKALVRDAGGLPLSGVNVTFTAPGSGASGTFDAATTVATDAAGIATAPSFTANTVPGAFVVTGAVGAQSASFNLTNTEGAPFSIFATQGSGQSAILGGSFATVLQARVVDQFNNPVPGVSVNFTAPGAGATGTFTGPVSSMSATTNAAGVATASAFTANAMLGSFTVTATVPGLSTPFSLFTINDAPSFTVGGALSVAEDSGAYSAPKLGSIQSGVNASAQTLIFMASNDNTTLFSVQPALSPTGVLSFTPALDAVGVATVTVRAQDDGGTANNGSDTSAPQTFTITLTPLNDAPTLDQPANAVVLEDSGAGTIALTGTTPGPGEAGQSLSFTYTSSVSTLIPNQTTPQTVTGNSALLNFTPAANQTGTTILTITLLDNGASGGANVNSVTRTLNITVLPVNDPPVFTLAGNASGIEDSATTIANQAAVISNGGAADEAVQSVSYLVSNNNPNLFSVEPAIDAAGTLSFTPAPDATGSSVITVRAQDDGGTGNGGIDTSAAQTFTLTVSPLNDAPSLDQPANVTVVEDSGTTTIPLTGITSGNSDAAQTLSFTYTSNAPLLIPSQSTAQLVTGNSALLSFTAQPNLAGTAILTITLIDNGAADATNFNSVSRNVTITVQPVNDAPVFTHAGNVTVLEDSGVATIAQIMSVQPGANDPAQNYTYLVSNSDPVLFALQPAISSAGSLTFMPAPNVFGIVTVTVRVQDDGGTANGGQDISAAQSFTITISPLNDAPTLDQPANVTVFEDSGTTTVALTGITAGVGESTQTLSFTYASSAPGIIASQSAPQVVTGNSALLSFTPLANANGTTDLTITLIDNGGTGAGDVNSVTRVLRVNVQPVNDAPIATGQTLSVIERNPLALALSGTDIDSGILTYTVVSTPQHGALSGLSPNLTYTPVTGYVGPDSFTFKANDGQLDSALGTISITVQTNNAVPSVTAISQTAGRINQTPFPLNVTGTNFVNGSVVIWNGAALATTFVSATQLNASVAAINLMDAGRIPVAVQTPVPGFAESNALEFFLYSGTVGNWIVTTTSDSGQGSLRLALASARNGDTISFDATVFDLVNSDAATLINVLDALPAMDDGSVTIDASNRRVTVNGSGANSASGLVITSNDNRVLGLNIIGFSRSGIAINSGAQRNMIGGNRKIGSSPNGQGLRLSGNGAFGVEISGIGTNENTIRGCWIGLDAAGTAAQPNLAGVLIKGGAKLNTVGGVADGEANIISGNAFEGVTVSGTGTDQNAVTGNGIGVAGVDAVQARGYSAGSRIFARSAIGNGSSGVFLSQGTQSTQVGGDTTAQANNVANNGGNGVEVRALLSKRNATRNNSITRNGGGGIALFDGSNGGVRRPIISKISYVKAASRASSRAFVRALVSMQGTVPPDDNGVVRNGTVEVFTDSGAQGETFAGRAQAVNGVWSLEIETGQALNITATMTDTDGNTSAFEVFKGPILANDSLNGVVGQALSYTISATGSPTAFDAAPLPAGLSVNTSTGIISGTPTAEGTSTAGLTATNAGGTAKAALTITIAPTPSSAVITSSLTASATQNVPFSYDIVASGTAPFVYTAIGLPEGLSLNGATIGGTPTRSGAVDVLISASNGIGSSQRVLRLSIVPVAGSANSAPQIFSLPSASTSTPRVGSPVVFTAAAGDPDNNLLAYTWDFGDGTSGTGPNPSHIYAVPGNYVVSVLITDGIETVSNSFAVTAVSPGQVDPLALDSDGDGFTNAIELALGTGVGDAASTPFNLGASTPQPLNLQRLSVRLNFIKASKDSIELGGTLPLPEGFTPQGGTLLIVDVGGVVKQMLLNPQGLAKAGNDSFKLRVKRSAKVTGIVGSRFMAKFSKSDFDIPLADEKITGETDMTRAPRTVVVTILFNGALYQKSQNVLYSARAGKSGRAK